MSRFSLKDRLLTPSATRAAMSPGAIIAVATGVAAGIVVGLPIIATAGIGVAAWAARIGLAVPRNVKTDKIEPNVLSEPWRGFVTEALDASARFDDAVHRLQPGPLQDRLVEIAGTVRSGVNETWCIARAGNTLCEARGRIDVADITRQLTEVGGGSNPASDSTGPVAQTIVALDAQLATARRMDEVIVDTRNRLRLIDAKRDEAVARAIEMSVRPNDDVETQGLIDLNEQVGSLVEEMDALRQALDETG